VGVEVMFGVAYFLIPPSGLRAVAYSIVSLGMVAAVVVGVRRWKPAQPMAWYLIAGGQLLFSIGDAINYYREWVLKTEIPFPSVADGFYLVFYPLLAAGLLLLVRGRAPGRDAASLIDATIITTGIGMLSWVFLIGPYVRLPDLSLAQRLVSIAYPAGRPAAAGGGGAAVAGWRGRGGRLPPARLRTVRPDGLGHRVRPQRAQQQLADRRAGRRDLDAVLHRPGAGRPAPVDGVAVRAGDGQPAADQTRLALLAGASLMAPAMLVIQAVRNEPIDVGVIAGGSVVLFLLALARMGGLASEVASRPNASGPCRRCCGRPSRSGSGSPPTSTTAPCRS
jgi:hypothetical protein